MFDEKGYRYLYHILKKKNLESVLSHGMLYNEHDRYNMKIQAEGVYSITTFDFSKPWVVWPGQYPGLYMNLTDELPKLEKDEVLLLFPTELLRRQKNWHFNLFDRNGTIGYDTYTYENMDTLPYFYAVKTFYKEKVGRYYNELVFHHSVDIHNCQFVYDGKELHPISDFGIEYKLTPNEKPGLFLYYSDRWYTGMDVPYYNHRDEYKTSVEFYKEYCKKCISINKDSLFEKIDKETDKNGIEKVIEPYMIELYNNV